MKAISRMRCAGAFQTPLRARQLYWGWSTLAARGPQRHRGNVPGAPSTAAPGGSVGYAPRDNCIGVEHFRREPSPVAPAGERQRAAAAPTPGACKPVRALRPRSGAAGMFPARRLPPRHEPARAETFFFDARENAAKDDWVYTGGKSGAVNGSPEIKLCIQGR